MFTATARRLVQYVGNVQPGHIKDPAWCGSVKAFCETMEKEDPRITKAEIKGSQPHKSNDDPNETEDVISVRFKDNNDQRVATAHSTPRNTTVLPTITNLTLCLTTMLYITSSEFHVAEELARQDYAKDQHATGGQRASISSLPLNSLQTKGAVLGKVRSSRGSSSEIFMDATLDLTRQKDYPQKSAVAGGS
ncbi:MAG: hypothetical protein M1837_005101 [Sclerophora amabilis]|nr:MAG: hypothetical protein M1837_005101 [Sclerophora amabilis]